METFGGLPFHDRLVYCCVSQARFVLCAENGGKQALRADVAEYLLEAYGCSRSTGFRWVKRYEELGGGHRKGLNPWPR